MFWFKLCPRCTGDLFEDQDQYGPFLTCMQCGFSKDVSRNHQGRFVINAEAVPVPAAPPSTSAKRRRISHGGRHFARTFAFGTDTAESAA